MAAPMAAPCSEAGASRPPSGSARRDRRRDRARRFLTAPAAADPAPAESTSRRLAGADAERGCGDRRCEGTDRRHRRCAARHRSLDLLAIGLGPLRRLRVIKARCRHPVPARGRVPQLLEKPRGVVGVGRRIESLLQGREGGGMMHEVDLRAADVDGPHASSLSLPHPCDRLPLGVEEVRLTLGVDRPRPGLAHARGLVAPAALDDADRLQQTRWGCRGAPRRQSVQAGTFRRL